jgi:hypothetical protein
MDKIKIVVTANNEEKGMKQTYVSNVIYRSIYILVYRESERDCINGLIWYTS